MSGENIVTIQRADVQVVQTFIDTMVGIPKFSYPARQNGAEKPPGEFAHIRLLEEYAVGIPNNRIASQTELETTFRVISPTRLRFRVGVVDTTGIPSTMILHGWTTEAMKLLMIQSGYGFIRCTPLSNESAKLEKEWEMRQGFSIELYSTRIFEYTTNNITSLRAGGEFVEGSKSYLLNFEINE
jgi:hypothetical protein